MQLKSDDSGEACNWPPRGASAIACSDGRLRSGNEGFDPAVPLLRSAADRDAALGRLLSALVPPAAPPISAKLRRGRALSIGVFLHLVSVGLVAATTIGVFFGVGVSLLRQPAHALVSSLPTAHRGSESGTALPAGLPRIRAAACADPERALATTKKAEPLHPAALLTAPRPTLAAAAAVAGPAPKALSSAPAPADRAASVAPRLPDRQTAELLARGDVYLRAGDIASARLFYERAADAGDGHAALQVGATFDPTFLASVGLRSLPGDPAQALFWYRRALGLGVGEAEPHLKRLETK